MATWTALPGVIHFDEKPSIGAVYEMGGFRYVTGIAAGRLSRGAYVFYEDGMWWTEEDRMEHDLAIGTEWR